MATNDLKIRISVDKDTGAIKVVDKEFSNLSTTVKNSDSSMISFNKSLLQTGAIAATAFYALNKTLGEVARTGFAYNSAIEQSKAGLVALSVAVQDKTIPVMERYSRANTEAGKTLEKLQKINAQTPHTLDQTNQIYKAMYVSMNNAGASTADMIEMTRSLSIASGAAGIEFNSLLAGVDGLATGTVLANSDLGRFISGLGLTNEALKESDDVVALITNTLKDFKAADTMAVSVSNLSNAWSQLTGEITASSFESAKDGMDSLSEIMQELTHWTHEYNLQVEHLRDIKSNSNMDDLLIQWNQATDKVKKYTKEIENSKLAWYDWDFEPLGNSRVHLIQAQAELKKIERILNKQGIDEVARVKSITAYKESLTKDLTEAELKANQLLWDSKYTLLSEEMAFKEELYQEEYEAIEKLKQAQLDLEQRANQSWYNSEKEDESKEKSFFDLTATETEKINALYMENYNLFESMFDETQMEAFFKKWNKELSDVNKSQDKYEGIGSKDWTAGLTGQSKGLANIGNAFADITDEQKKWTKYSEENTVTEEDKNKHLSNQLTTYGNLAGAVGSMYEQGTSGAQAMMQVQQALAIVEGGLAVVHQMSSGDVYTAIPRALAVAAMVSQFVDGFGGGASSDYSRTIESANTTTVFGGGDDASESLANSMDIVSDLAEPQFSMLSSMNEYLASIDANIRGSAADIIRTGEYALGVGAIEAQQSYVGTDIGGLISLGGGYNWQMLTGSGIAFGDSNAVAGQTYSASESYYGGTSSQQAFTSRTLEDTIENFAGLLFQSQAFESMSKKWYGSASYSYSSATTYQEMTSELENSLSRTFENIRDAIVVSSDTLGKDVEATLNNLVVDIGNIDLSGLSGEELIEKLNNEFSAQADIFTQTLYGTSSDSLAGFQDIGEGLFETLVRVSSGMEIAEYYAGKLGSAYEDVNFEEIVNKKGEVSLESLKQSILGFENVTYSVGNGVADIVSYMQGTADDLYDTYDGLVDIRSQIEFLGISYMALSSSMLLGADGVDNLSSSLNSFYENFLDEQERLTYSIQDMTSEFNKLGLSLPTSTNEFKELVVGIDTSTESGQQLLGSVLALSDGFADLTSDMMSMLDAERSNALELASLNRTLQEESLSFYDEAISAVESLSNTFETMIDSIDGTITTLLGNSDASNAQDILISSFWEKRSEADALLAKDGDLTSDESTQLNSLIGSISSLATDIQSASAGNNSAITDSLVSELYSLQNEISLDNQILQTKIVDANGKDIDVANETGVLLDLTNAINKYNDRMDEALGYTNNDLAFDDFQAGGLLATADEINFRQSFQADSYASFSDELEQLRLNLSYLSLSTTDASDFLSELSQEDSTGYSNIQEFFETMGEVPENVDKFFAASRGQELVSQFEQGAIDYQQLATAWGSEDIKERSEGEANFQDISAESYLKAFKSGSVSSDIAEWNIENQGLDFRNSGELVYDLLHYDFDKLAGYELSSAAQEMVDTTTDAKSLYDMYYKSYLEYWDFRNKYPQYADIANIHIDANYNKMNEIEDTLRDNLYSMRSVDAYGIQIDGSHANGLSYVPFDGYRAELHKGERVLTAEENRVFEAPVNMQTFQNNNKEVADLLRTLIKKVESIDKSDAKTARVLENVMYGVDTLKTEART